MGYIYLVTNKITGKHYVGQTLQTDINTRWNQHKRLCTAMLGRCILSAYQKYGINNFDFKIICICFDTACNELEEYYINKFNTLAPNGYNLQTGGNNSKHSEETKALMSRNRKGKGLNCVTEEMRQTRIGRFAGEKNPNFGKIISDEQKKKISDGMKKVWREKKEVGFTLTDKQLEALKKGQKRLRSKKEIPNKIQTVGRKQRVGKLDEEGNVLEEFESIAEASKMSGALPQVISSVCQGVKKHAGGFKWKYLNVEGTVKRNNSTSEIYITKANSGYMIRINKSNFKRQAFFNTLEDAVKQRNDFIAEFENM
jgi:group I intron endonuclease